MATSHRRAPRPLNNSRGNSRVPTLILKAVEDAPHCRMTKSSASVTRYRLLRTDGAPAKPFGLSGETLK
jgi:hypothetical protein